MSLYSRINSQSLPLVTNGTPFNEKPVKTSQTSLEENCNTQKTSFSYISDILDSSTPVKTHLAKKPQVTFGTFSHNAGEAGATPCAVGAWHSGDEVTAPTIETVVAADTSEKKVIAWINSHPPDLPNDQNHCAACGEFIQVYDIGWVILGDGALVHHGGKHGDACHKKWARMRRDEANNFFNPVTGD